MRSSTQKDRSSDELMMLSYERKAILSILRTKSEVTKVAIYCNQQNKGENQKIIIKVRCTYFICFYFLFTWLGSLLSVFTLSFYFFYLGQQGEYLFVRWQTRQRYPFAHTRCKYISCKFKKSFQPDGLQVFNFSCSNISVFVITCL